MGCTVDTQWYTRNVVINVNVATVPGANHRKLADQLVLDFLIDLSEQLHLVHNKEPSDKCKT